MTRLAILLFVFAWALATAPAQAQECAEPVSTGRVTAQVEEIENAWASRRREGIAAGLADLLADLECVRTPLSPQLVARVHRARGLAFVVEGDSAHTRYPSVRSQVTDPGT